MAFRDTHNVENSVFASMCVMKRHTASQFVSFKTTLLFPNAFIQNITQRKRTREYFKMILLISLGLNEDVTTWLIRRSYIILCMNECLQSSWRFVQLLHRQDCYFHAVLLLLLLLSLLLLSSLLLLLSSAVVVI